MPLRPLPAAILRLGRAGVNGGTPAATAFFFLAFLIAPGRGGLAAAAVALAVGGWYARRRWMR